MILVLCANAAVDRTYEVSNFQVGRYHRPTRVLVSAGGKGINAARVLAALRHPVTVAGFAGGRAGAFIAADLRRHAIRPAFTQIREESRTVLTIVDPQSRQTTRLDEYGPLVSPAELEALHNRWRELLAEAEVAVISGNPPRGVPRDFYARLLRRATEQGVPTVVDAHEQHLQGALAGRPHLLKPNLQELSWLAKRPLEVPEGVVQFSRALLQEGVEVVLTTLGKGGAILVARGSEPLLATPPMIEKVLSDVGAGDAALAGFVAAMREGRPPAERARWAVAAGAASCTSLGAGVCTREQVEALVAKSTVEALE